MKVVRSEMTDDPETRAKEIDRLAKLNRAEFRIVR